MIVVSNIDKPNQLTKGKSYQVITRSVTFYSNFTNNKKYILYIIDDSGSKNWYYEKDFLSLSDYRELNIDNLLQDDK